MPTLTSGGIGSGLDVAGLVSKLIAAERAPTEARLAVKESTLQARLSGFGQLRGALDKIKSALDALATTSLFGTIKATSADDKIFTASADQAAVAGTYTVEITALAKAQKLTSGAFASADTVVGTGSLTLTLAGRTATLTIDDSNKTLAGIRSAINAARDGAGQPLGITATLVTSTGGVEPAGTYLVLTSTKTGEANTISVTQSGGDAGLAAVQYQTGGLDNALNESEAAADAMVKVDGFTYKTSSNTVSGALSGVTLNLKATTTAPLALTVAADTSGVRAKLQALVDAYNGLGGVLEEQGGYNAATKKGGVLIGDPALRGVESQLRRVLADPVPGATGAAKSASDIGLSIDGSGKLKLDGAKFDALLTSDPGALAGVLQGGDGLVKRLSGVVDGYLNTSGGILKARTDGLNRTLTDISDQRDALNARLEALQQRYLAQFNALDGLLSQIQSTGNFLTQQLATLPGANTGR
jgi:flagellar hook-associated protein 2